jgi:hypothetical protein
MIIADSSVLVVLHCCVLLYVLHTQLPDFLDGLFNMLSDSNREIRQAADGALAEFLRYVLLPIDSWCTTTDIVKFGS